MSVHLDGADHVASINEKRRTAALSQCPSFAHLSPSLLLLLLLVRITTCRARLTDAGRVFSGERLNQLRVNWIYD